MRGVDVLDEIRAAQEARGCRGRSIEQMQANEAERRAEAIEYEERCRALWGLKRRLDETAESW